MLFVCYREETEMRWFLLYGWRTHLSCCISSAVMLMLHRWVSRLRMCWLSVCRMHLCCSSTPCRTNFTRRCLHLSVPVLTLTVLLVSSCVVAAAVHFLSTMWPCSTSLQNDEILTKKVFFFKCDHVGLTAAYRAWPVADSLHALLKMVLCCRIYEALPRHRCYSLGCNYCSANTNVSTYSLHL